MKDFLLNIDPITGTVIATLFTFLLTSLGASVVFFFKSVNKKVMDGMLGFASGVMIAASFFSLLSPAVTLSESLNICTWFITFLGFICGGLFLILADSILDNVLERKEKFKKNSFKRIFMLIFSITLHNIPEGLAIGVAFGSLYYGISEGSLLACYLLAIGIGIQNFPEGSAVSIPLRREKVSTTKSFIIGSLSGIVEPIAGVLGALLVMKIRLFLPFLLSFAAGAMIYVVVNELIPESQNSGNKKIATFLTLLGFSIMMILDIALG